MRPLNHYKQWCIRRALSPSTFMVWPVNTMVPVRDMAERGREGMFGARKRVLPDPLFFRVTLTFRFLHIFPSLSCLPSVVVLYVRLSCLPVCPSLFSLSPVLSLIHI